MEILKDLLKKVFDAPLNRLEKRSALQMEDLKYEKKCYTQQGKLLDFLCTVKIKPIAKKKPILKRERSADTMMRRNNTFKNPSNKNREKTPDLNNHKIPINKTRNKTPNLANKNGIPSYMMGTANSQKNKKEAIHNHYYNLRKQREEEEEKDKKISLTPEPKKRKNVKKKNIDNNSNDNSQLTINNINIIKKDDLNDKKSIVSNINCINNENGLNNNESNLNNNKQENEIMKSPFEKKEEDINIKNIGKILMSKENENIFKIILSFLNQKEKMDFFLTNKKCLPYLLSIIETYKDNLETKYGILTDSIENRKQNLKNKFPNLNTTDVPTYKILNSAEISLNILNTNHKIFDDKNLTSEQEKIIIIYRIFLQLIKQSEISNIKNNKEFWIKCCDYINENGKDKIGDFFKDSSNYFDLSAENVFKIQKMTEGNEDKITNRAYYSSICGTTTIVSLLIRDVLEFIGVLKKEKKNDANYLYRNLEYLDYVCAKVSDYINRLKNAINSNK